MARARTLAVVLSGLAVVGQAVPASAVPLTLSFGAQPFLDTGLGGTTVAARPELAGTVIEDEIQAFSIPGLNITGTVQSRVVREDGSGTLDFYWRVLVEPTSTGGGVSAFRLGDFGFPHITDADWRIDGLGSAAPFVARVFNPANRPDGAINFLFTDPWVGPGDPALNETGSRFFFLHTNATAYARTAHYDLLGGQSQTLSPSYETFAPAAVPEPGTLTLLGLGLGVSSRLARRRDRSARR